MGSSSCVLPTLILLVLFFHFGVSNSLQLPSCHDEEFSALLQFKQSFAIVNESESIFSSWKPPLQGENNTCCSWYGVECDEKTGHVIGLDLQSGQLYGSINSNSTLFHLVHLETLNLAVNDFNSSPIPPTIRDLSKLRYLNLGQSYFGHAPSEISQLSKLKTLYLYNNYNMFSDKNFLRSLAQNLTSLEKLDLSFTTISSTLPDTLANLSHLTYLSLLNCGLFGKLPFSFGNLRHLISLDLGNNQLIGQIPASLGNLTQLTDLLLLSNQLSGTIPASLGNLTRLTRLKLSRNNINGSIPQFILNLMNLQYLSLDNNNLSGTVEFDQFIRLQNLTILDLSSNRLEVLTESRSLNNSNITVPKYFAYLGLGWCNIREFPRFLRSQVELGELDLSGNKLQGQVPKWMWNTSTQSLWFLNISHNFLTGFAQSPAIFPWVNLQWLDLSFNMLSELLLPPSTSILYINMANNKLTGQVSPMICNLTFLKYLDLSNNKLIGVLPECGENFGVQLQFLNVGNNSFHGVFPQSSYISGSKLRMLDISHNNFHGQLPRSLVNCASLEGLILSYNEFNDTFPVWLGALPELKILTMDHNMFYGVIVKPHKENLHFLMMRILDLSYNNFSGEFPFEYIFSGNGTRSITNDLKYYSIQDGVGLPGTTELYYSFTIMSKGVARYYTKIHEDLILIDVSSNAFEGKIPEFIGKLKGIWSLNMSNNILTDSIPSSLSNLSRLESLDLSQNKLSGEIPQQLAQLDFLTIFNVSHNYLTGPVPRGKQFNTFDSTSYQGNQGLCGDLLPEKCGNPEPPQLPPSTSHDNDSGSGIELDWKFAVAGFGSGLLMGVVLADFFITKWSGRFIEVVAVLIRLSKRRRRLKK